MITLVTLRELVDTVDEMMQEANFTKRDVARESTLWQLETRETINVLELQAFGNSRFYINAGILMKALSVISFPAIAHCHIYA